MELLGHAVSQFGVRVIMDNEDLYGDLVRGFFSEQFPTAVPADKATKLDLVTSALIGTGQVRLGPQPNPESHVAIRAVVQHAIDHNQPIPVLTPWGSKKPRNGMSIDIAEVAALKQLACIQDRVQRYHTPGLRLIIRIEDASGYYLFGDELNCRPSIDTYSRDFVKLVRVLGLGFIEPLLETNLFDAQKYADMTDALVPTMEQYIFETDIFGFDGWQERESRRRLHDFFPAFQGEIPREQRDYYRGLYKKLFPGIGPAEATHKLARYLSSAIVRNKIRGRGDDPSWEGKYLQVTFAPPIPGAPAGTVSRFLYYRTLPTSMGTTHIPPWRAKGYLRMDGRRATPKIASWSDIPSGLVSCSVQLTNSNEALSITTDYLVAD